MTTIVTRAGKGSPLTHTEVDTNFTNLNTAKLETAAIPLGTLQAPSVSFLNDSDTGIFCPQGGNSLAIATGAQYAITCTSTQAVGIKTANPQKALHVAGATRVGADDATDAFLEIGEGATGDRNSYIDIVADTTYTDYGLRVIRNNGGADATSEIKHRGTGAFNIVTQEAAPIQFYTTNSPRLTITSGGNVGIGTSSPAFKFEVAVASVNGIGAFIPASSAGITDFSTGGVGWRFTRPSNGAYIHSIYSYDTAAGASNNFVIQSRNDIVFTNGGDHTNSIETMRITSGNRVGIGTTSPQSLLNISTASIAGDQNVLICGTAATGITGSHALYLGAYGSTQYGCKIKSIYNYAASVSTQLSFEISNAGTLTEAARIDSSGRLLVGTTTNLSGSPLQVAASTPVITVAQSSTDVTADMLMGAFNVYSKDSSTTSSGGIGGIRMYAATAYNTGSTPSYLTFHTHENTINDGTEFGTTTERMRITKEGSSRFFCSAGADGMDVASAEVSGTTRYLFLGAHSATGTGTGTNCYRLYTNGNVQNTNNSYGAISDAKLKENIVDATSQWSDIKNLQVRKYNFKEETGHQTHTQIGIIAQEVELISPGLVNESPDRDAEGNDLGTVTKSVNYSVLYMKAVKALQEAMERIEQLEADVAALKA